MRLWGFHVWLNWFVPALILLKLFICFGLFKWFWGIFEILTAFVYCCFFYLHCKISLIGYLRCQWVWRSGSAWLGRFIKIWLREQKSLEVICCWIFPPNFSWSLILKLRFWSLLRVVPSVCRWCFISMKRSLYGGVLHCSRNRGSSTSLSTHSSVWAFVIRRGLLSSVAHSRHSDL